MNRKEQDKVLSGADWLIVTDKHKDCSNNNIFIKEQVIDLLNGYKDYIYKVYNIKANKK